MYLSFSHQFVYIEIPGTGIDGFSTVLRPFTDVVLGQDDQYDVNFFPSLKFAEAKVIQKQFPSKWGNLLSFALVKHPLNRLVDTYFTKSKKQKHDVSDFMTWIEKRKMKPMTFYLNNAAQERIVTCIIKHENFREDSAKLIAHLGIESFDFNLPIEPQYPESWLANTELKNYILANYQADFEQLGYAWPTNYR
jgi:hypothetical protein